MIDQPPRVFISKATADLGIARRLVGLLQAAGFQPWISEDHLPPGPAYAAGLEEALEGSSAVVLVVSDASLSSDNVYKEIDSATDKRLPVLPVTAPGYTFAGRASLPKRWRFHIGPANIQTDGDLAAVVAACVDELRADPEPPPAPQPRNYRVATTNPRAFVGDARAVLLRDLRAHWERVRATGTSALVVLLAESGYGKTRIVQELYRQLAASQPQPGFWPADLLLGNNDGQRALRESRKRVAPADFEPPTGARADYLWLGHAVPEGMAGRVDHGLIELGEGIARALDLAARMDPDGRAARMVDQALAGHSDAGMDRQHAVAELLHRGHPGVATAVPPGSVEAFWQGLNLLWNSDDALPAVIAIEDGHFAGRETVTALEQVMCGQESQLTGAPSTGGQSVRPLGQMLAEGVTGVDVRRLDRLTDDEVGRVFREAIPDLDASTLRAAVRKVDGNPYYARTLLVAMSEAAGTVGLDAAWIRSRPQSFEGELLLQWNDLELDVRRVLSGIAVLGTQVPERLGVRALAAASDRDQSQALAASLGTGWLRRLGSQDALQVLGESPIQADKALRFLERPRWVIAHQGAATLWKSGERRRIITEALQTLQARQSAHRPAGAGEHWLQELHLALALAADREGCEFDRAAAIRAGLASAMTLRLANDDGAHLDVARKVEQLIAGHEHEPDLGELAAESALSLKVALTNQPGGGTDPDTVAAAELAVSRAHRVARSRPDLAARAHAALCRAVRSRSDADRLARSEQELREAANWLEQLHLPDPVATAEVLHAQALSVKMHGDDHAAARHAGARFKILQAEFGPLDRRVTAALGNLAFYVNRIDSARAIELRRELLHRRIEAWGGAEVVPVAFAQKELAVSLLRESNQTTLVEALELAEQAMSTYAQARGAGHRKTLAARSVVVLCLLRVGDRQESDGSLTDAATTWRAAEEAARLNVELTPEDATLSTQLTRRERLGEALVRLGNPAGMQAIRERLEWQAALPQPAPEAPRELSILWTAEDLVAGHMRFDQLTQADEVAQRFGLEREKRYPAHQPRGWRSVDPRHALAGVL